MICSTSSHNVCSSVCPVVACVVWEYATVTALLGYNESALGECLVRDSSQVEEGFILDINPF